MVDKILGNGMVGLQQYIKYKYCNPEFKENYTIKYTNKRQNDIQIRKEGKWITSDKNKVLDQLYQRNNNVEQLLEIYEKINNKSLKKLKKN